MFVLPEDEDSSLSSSCSSSSSSSTQTRNSLSADELPQEIQEEKHSLVQQEPMEKASIGDTCSFPGIRCYKDTNSDDETIYAKQTKQTEIIDLHLSEDDADDDERFIELDSNTLKKVTTTSLQRPTIQNPYKKTNSARNETVTVAAKTNVPSRNFHISYNKKSPLMMAITEHPAAEVRRYTTNSHPVPSRTRLPVSSIFHSKLSSTFSSFWHYTHFNTFQTEMVPVIFDAVNNANVCVSAPTGAGKTGCFEMSIIHLFQQVILQSNRTTDDDIIDRLLKNKVLYIAPSKALCEERCNAWTRQFSTLLSKTNNWSVNTIQCLSLTGDYYCDQQEESSVYTKIQNAHIIITTPEKWDSLTRKWKENLGILQMIHLLLLDEVHLLGDASRGCCLETVICRMKMVSNSSFTTEEEDCFQKRGTKKNMRIVAVSATLPNCDDIATFLECPQAHVFDGSYRPVPLTVHVVSCGAVRNNNQFLFDKSLNARVPNILEEYSNKKPAIVFCHTKKETEVLAMELSRNNRYDLSTDDKKSLGLASKRASASILQKCLLTGVGYHHAGMEPSDRQLVENTFASGAVKCLFATSTLAMGVNLPAHLVVIKGTTMWRGAGAGYAAIDSGTLLQMMGRAGRPGFDTSGTAVIMTDVSRKTYYENMDGPGAKLLESQLLARLVEKMNVEISQGVIQNSNQCVRWLKSTFFFARVRKNPQKYAIKGTTEHELEEFLLKTCNKALADLEAAQIIDIREDRCTILPKVASHVMSYHLVDFASMKLFMSLPHDSGPVQILQVLARCGELQHPIRRSEKNALNAVHKVVKYKLDQDIKFRVQTPSQKAFVLLQASIGQHYLEDFSLRQEMTQIVDVSQRLLKAIEDYSVRGSLHGAVALESLLLRRSLATSLWGPSDGVLNQLHGIGSKITKKLAEGGISTFLDVMASSNQAIEQASGRHHPFGQDVRKVVAEIFYGTLSLSAFIDSCGDGSKKLVCRLEKCALDDLPNLPPIDEKPKDVANKSERVVAYTLTAHTDRKRGILIFRGEITSPGEYIIPCPEKFGRIYIRLVSNLVGLDGRLALDGDQPIETTLFPTCPLASNEKSAKGASNKKKSSKEIPSNQEKRAILAEKQLEMVNQVCDARLPKKNPSSARELSPVPSSRKSFFDGKQCVSNTENKKMPSVTPSPNPGPGHLPLKGEETVQLDNIIKSGTGQTPSSPNRQVTPKFNSGASKMKRGAPLGWVSASWQDKRRQQASLQDGSYGAKAKKNPFSSYSFDPNNAESRLESLSAQFPNAEKDNSIIPSNFSVRKPINCAIRTPAKSGLACSVVLSNRRKLNGYRSGYINERDLLERKAAEQNNYMMQSNDENRGQVIMAGRQVPLQTTRVQNRNSSYPFCLADALPHQLQGSGYHPTMHAQGQQFFLGGEESPAPYFASYGDIRDEYMASRDNHQSLCEPGSDFPGQAINYHSSKPFQSNFLGSAATNFDYPDNTRNVCAAQALHPAVGLSQNYQRFEGENSFNRNYEVGFDENGNYHSNEFPYVSQQHKFAVRDNEASSNHGGSYDNGSFYHPNTISHAMQQGNQRGGLNIIESNFNRFGRQENVPDSNFMTWHQQRETEPNCLAAGLNRYGYGMNIPFVSRSEQSNIMHQQSMTCQSDGNEETGQQDYFAELDNGIEPSYECAEIDELLGYDIDCPINSSTSKVEAKGLNQPSLDEIMEQAFF